MKRTSHTKLGLFIILILVFLAAWANGAEIKEEVKADTVELKPVIKEFKALIDSDPTVRMYFTQMIDQVPGYYKHNLKPDIYINSIDQMLYLVNNAIDKAPVYDETDLVGFPINAIFNWTMGVPAGFSA
jgi:phosphatidylserine decarboxylase